MEEKINSIKNGFNFSQAGKSSIKKYLYLIDRNKESNEKILKYKKRRKLFEDFFQDNVMSAPNSININSYFSSEDIFSKCDNPKTIITSTGNKNKENRNEFEIRTSCSYLNKNKNTESDIYKIRKNIINNNYEKSFDKYKYHLLHHNETNIDMFEKRKVQPSCTRYNPKLDYIYKKIIYSIPFKKISGRQIKSEINKNKNIKVNITKLKKNKNKFKNNSVKELKLNTARNNTNIQKNEKFIPGSVNMKYQLPRQSLPNHNDFRIRINNNDNSYLFGKNQNSLTEKKSKTIFSFKITSPSPKIINSDNYIITNYSNLQPSLNVITKRTTNSLINFSRKNYKKKNNKNKNNNEDNIINEGNKLFKKDSKTKKNENININKKILKKNEKDDDSKIPSDNIDNSNQEKFMNTTSYKSYMNRNNYSKKNAKNNTNKLNIYISKSCKNLNINNKIKNYKGINFEKMLSREYLDKINRYEEPIHPMITPNYSSIEPKSIMKVVYSKNKYNNAAYNHKTEEFHGYNGDFTYDVNKIYYKYNNHTSPRVFTFNKMSGRCKDDNNSSLPFFMNRLSDRNSIENFNENSFKMNNYLNGNFRQIQSSFNDKKTYNVRLQLDELKNKNNINILEYNNKFTNNNKKDKHIHKKIRFIYNESKNGENINYNGKSKIFNKILRNKSWKYLLGDYYKIDFDDLEKYQSFIGTKVDGITLKSYKNIDKK